MKQHPSRPLELAGGEKDRGNGSWADRGLPHIRRKMVPRTGSLSYRYKVLICPQLDLWVGTTKLRQRIEDIGIEDAVARDRRSRS